MAGKSLTISLTDDQRKQIREATGKSITKLTIDMSVADQLTEKELEGIAGGGLYLKYSS